MQVERVEMKDVEIPQTMQRAMAQEAEAQREKRARIIKAEAELEAAMKLRQAADEISLSAAALELRRMQMLTENRCGTKHHDCDHDAERICVGCGCVGEAGGEVAFLFRANRYPHAQQHKRHRSMSTTLSFPRRRESS